MILLLCILCGLCLGVFYDVFKMLRRIFKASVVTANIQDGIFWVIAMAGIFVFLLIIDDGRMRLYEWCAIFSSWLIYSLTLSRYVVKAGVVIIEKTLWILLYPIHLILKIFKKPVFFAISLSRKSFRSIWSVFRKEGRKWSNSVKNLRKMYKKI